MGGEVLGWTPIPRSATVIAPNKLHKDINNYLHSHFEAQQVDVFESSISTLVLDSPSAYGQTRSLKDESRQMHSDCPGLVSI